MNQQITTLNTSDVRWVVSRLVEDQPLPERVVEATRQEFQSRLQRAADHGLTEAEVNRSLLQPIFGKYGGCDCPTCRWRRQYQEEATLQRVALAV